jgi:hypothetical protein
VQSPAPLPLLLVLLLDRLSISNRTCEQDNEQDGTGDGQGIQARIDFAHSSALLAPPAAGVARPYPEIISETLR